MTRIIAALIVAAGLFAVAYALLQPPPMSREACYRIEPGPWCEYRP